MNNSVRACALILLLAAAAMAQQETPPAQLPDVVALPAGAGFVGFRLETTRAGANDESVSVGDIQAVLVALAAAGAGHTIHRVLVDREGRLVFGYDLSVEPLAPAHRFKVFAEPLSAEFKEHLRTHGVGAHAAVQASSAAVLPTLLHATAPQTLDDGDAFALDLLINPQTGVRLTDVVKVATERTRLSPQAPRDFTLDSVALALTDFQLTVNGEPTLGGGRKVTGALVWFYLPGRGRFIFSLAPRAGYDFQKTGLIEDNKLSFNFHGEHYEWTSRTPITGQPGSWYVWVLHDADYTPEMAAPADAAARDAAKYDEQNALKDVLAGRTPHTTPGVGYSVKNPRAELDKRLPPRVRVGAADSMENVLPKR
jgi:hypothetical protein